MGKLRYRELTSLTQLGFEPGSLCCWHQQGSRKKGVFEHFRVPCKCLINSGLKSPALIPAPTPIPWTVLKSQSSGQVAGSVRWEEESPSVTICVPWLLATSGGGHPHHHQGPIAFGTNLEFTPQPLSPVLLNQGQFCPPRGHLAMFGDIVNCYSWG